MELPFYMQELVTNSFLRVKSFEMAYEDNDEESPKKFDFWQPWLSKGNNFVFYSILLASSVNF